MTFSFGFRVAGKAEALTLLSDYNAQITRIGERIEDNIMPQYFRWKLKKFTQMRTNYT